MPTVKFRVDEVSDSIIPSIQHVRGSGEGVEVLVEVSEKLGLKYKVGENLILRFTKNKPKDYTKNDYCGKAFLFSIKEKDGDKIYLFSVGGLIIRLKTKKKIRDLNIAEEYYFCVYRER